MRKFLSYSGFQRAIATALTAGMAVVILLAAAVFFVEAFQVAVGGDLDLDYSAFQSLFDRVLAAVIALELAHSLQQMAAGKHGIIQVRTVILIGVLAVVRKLILLEIEGTSGAYLAGLAAVILALGVVYTLILWIEKQTGVEPPPVPGD
ncbi:MAG: phosphate-starvation-inducible PsiE family protein [Pseudomonadota bacterium]